jgi:glycosyltransferase involved in cell wall biosynthesis
MKKYGDSILYSINNNFNVNFYPWPQIYNNISPLYFRYRKYLIDPFLLNRSNKSNIQHILDQSYANFISSNPDVIKIITVHDIIPLLGYEDSILKKKSHFLFSYVSSFFRKFNVIITNSNFTKNTLVNYLHLPEEKIHVIYSPITDSVNLMPIEKKDGLNFLLIGSSFYKNSHRAIEAASIFSEKYKRNVTIHWVISDIYTFNNYKYKCGSNFSIKKYFNLSQDSLDSLFLSCSALLFPSLVEGFGLPIIEAMARGLPVLTSNRGAMKEVSSGNAILLNPDSVDGIFSGIEYFSLLNDIQLEQIIRKGKIHSQNFTHEIFSNNILSVYNNLLK